MRVTFYSGLALVALFAATSEKTEVAALNLSSLAKYSDLDLTYAQI